MLRFHRTRLSRSASDNGPWERSPALQPRRWAVTGSSHRCPGAAGAGTRRAAPAAASPRPRSELQERAGTQRSGSARHSQGVLAALSGRSALGFRACGSATRLPAGIAGPRRDRNPAPPRRRGAATRPCPGGRRGSPRRAPPRREEEPPPAGSVRLLSAPREEAALLPSPPSPPPPRRGSRQRPPPPPEEPWARRPSCCRRPGSARGRRGRRPSGTGGARRSRLVPRDGGGWGERAGRTGPGPRGAAPARGRPERRERGAGRGGAERRSVSDRSARRRPRCVSRENQFSGVPAAPSARRAGFALGYRAVGKLTRSQTALRGGRGPRGRPALGHCRHGGAAPRPVLGRGRPGSGGRCRAAGSLPYRREFIVTQGEMDRFLSELASPLLGTRVGCVPAAGRSLRARAEPRAFPVAGCGAALPGGARGCLAAARAARSSDGGAEPDGPS